MDVAGHGAVALSMEVGRTANIHQEMGVGGDFTMHAGSTSGALNATEVFAVSSATGNTTTIGDVEAEELWVTGSSTITGQLDVAGTFDVAGTASSVGGNLYVDGTTDLDKTTVDGTAHVSGNLTANGRFATQGTVDVANAAVTGGTASLNGATTITSNLQESALNVTVNRSEGFAAQFKNTQGTGGQGVVFQAGTTLPGNDNNFVEFENGSGVVVGELKVCLRTRCLVTARCSTSARH